VVRHLYNACLISLSSVRRERLPAFPAAGLIAGVGPTSPCMGSGPTYAGGGWPMKTAAVVLDTGRIHHRASHGFSTCTRSGTSQNWIPGARSRTPAKWSYKNLLVDYFIAS
jgi:hypothetical protein